MSSNLAAGVALTLLASLSACSTASLPISLPQITLPNPLIAPGDTLTPLDMAVPLQLLTGGSQQLRIQVGGRAAQPGELLWSSSDERVVSVSPAGLLTAQGAGDATIRTALARKPSTFLEFPLTVLDRASLDPRALAVLELTNAARAQGHICGGVPYPVAPPLAYNLRLERAARTHAGDMAQRDYFSHIGPDGSTVGSRVSAAGYVWTVVAENIAAGQLDAEETVRGWLDSPEHCKAIMNAGLTEVGLGYAYAPGSRYLHYWVQDFGRR